MIITIYPIGHQVPYKTKLPIQNIPKSTINSTINTIEIIITEKRKFSILSLLLLILIIFKHFTLFLFIVFLEEIKYNIFLPPNEKYS